MTPPIFWGSKWAVIYMVADSKGTLLTGENAPLSGGAPYSHEFER